MRNHQESHQEFLSNLQGILLSDVQKSKLSSFVCTLTSRVEHSCSILNGGVFTKAPQQSTSYFETSLLLCLPAGETVSFSFSGRDIDHFSSSYKHALQIAAKLEFRSHLQRHTSYPKLDLTSPELMETFKNSTVVEKLQKIVEQLEADAAHIKHPRMMSREVGASLALSRRSYFDSVGNFAEEEGASCSLSAAFALLDSTEYFSDVVGTLPSPEECKNVVLEAAKNLLQSRVNPLGDSQNIAVLLSSKALVSLFSDLVMPNLQARSILDGTGAWDVKKLKEKVLVGVTLNDNPHLRYSPFSSAFDFEGTPTKPVEIMKNGMLNHPLLTSLMLAELERLRPDLQNQFHLTGHADSPSYASPTNLFIELEGEKLKSTDDLIRSAKTVVVINWLTGMSVDPLTGQFALDSEGAKVYENGDLMFSTSLTLRGNFFEALADPLRKVGPTERFYNTYAPSLLTKKLACVSKEMATHEGQS